MYLKAHDMSTLFSSIFRAGDLVEVRSKEEILATLDANGRLEEMPFMPEMLKHCGKTLRVGKRAHKTCDPALGIGGRKMLNTVHLENIRCNGAAHDGCEAACLIFWKDAWLKPAGEKRPSPDGAGKPFRSGGCSEETLWSTIKHPPKVGETEPTYVCQNTQVKFATQPLKWWDPRQYVEDYTSGNVRLQDLVAGLTFSVWRTVTEAGLGIGTAMRWIYDTFQRMRGGVPYPIRPFGVPEGSKAPQSRLDLQVGDVVRVKPYKDILETLDCNYRNRGLYFDPEMVPFTEREYEVERRQKQIIDEGSCKMVRFKTDAIILKDVVCEARYAICRRFCPRAIYPYWREIWLERVPQSQNPAN
ncbi:hypothetical protein [Bradyrhizobium australafricanum]|uniref:hypothetical protein n=1 Tax=Bradyrhizobium australafricanum TaxID=2821406 RepID=UPI001CE24817|nr:hypothetical protein [Bradyrhizobium australafricanum]MCA6097886.1 hypothetical protein [Bradyrhizobium australafricanum]